MVRILTFHTAGRSYLPIPFTILETQFLSLLLYYHILVSDLPIFPPELF